MEVLLPEVVDGLLNRLRGHHAHVLHPVELGAHLRAQPVVDDKWSGGATCPSESDWLMLEVDSEYISGT